MLIQNSPGSSTAGPLDILVILHDINRNTFHAAFFEEYPFLGPPQDWRTLDSVRLRSKMHHTMGATSLEDALVHLEALATRIIAPPENVGRFAVPWNGETGIVWILPNWHRPGLLLEGALKQCHVLS